MPKINHLFALFLVLGIVYAEMLPTLQPTANAIVYSQSEPTQNHSEELLSLLLNQAQSSVPKDSYLNNVVFISAPDALPSVIPPLFPNLNDITATTPQLENSKLLRSPSDSILEEIPADISNVPIADQPYIGDVIPQLGTSLFLAYANGGRAWYSEDNKVIVRFPDDTLKSFDKFTGEEISWLQDRLNYPAVTSPGALQNYLTAYRGQIVAETESWALVKFPSGGFLKIAKSQQLQYEPFLGQQ